jgi:predicted regulator of Ras-like GTPase activity (Roadblock/LC7/MglB family)
VIDADTGGAVDAERLAALVPLAVGTAEELGIHSRRESLATAVLEYENGAAIITMISPDAMLLVIAELDELAPLLFELRRNRSRLALLV